RGKCLPPANEIAGAHVDALNDARVVRRDVENAAYRGDLPCPFDYDIDVDHAGQEHHEREKPNEHPDSDALALGRGIEQDRGGLGLERADHLANDVGLASLRKPTRTRGDLSSHQALPCEISGTVRASRGSTWRFC